MKVKLPSVDEPSERLLEDYARPLLAALTRDEQTAAVAEQLSEGAADLRNVLRSRELCERLAVRADALAESAESALELEIRALYDGLSRETRARQRLFPVGLGAALAPRGSAQVGEAKRLYVGLSTVGRAVSAQGAVRLGFASDALANRLSASAAAHAALLQVIAEEHRQRRLFRGHYHGVYGTLLGQFAENQKRLAGYFNKQPSLASKPKALPPAPARASSLSKQATKKAKGRKPR